MKMEVRRRIIEKRRGMMVTPAAAVGREGGGELDGYEADAEDLEEVPTKRYIPNGHTVVDDMEDEDGDGDMMDLD